jgi:flagellar basal body-associated protein FliL
MPAAVGCPLVLLLLAVCGYLAWLLISSTASGWRSPEPASQQTAQPSKEEALATLINFNGKLCAKVILISPKLSSGEYQVNCEEYREAEKSGTKNNMVVYMVNLDRGTVRLVGRG